MANETMLPERSAETKAINAQLEIVKLNGERFEVPGGYMKPDGYCFRHPELGFLSFKGDKPIPYIPRGGWDALQSILDDGGLLDFDTIVWRVPMPVTRPA